MEPRDFRSPEYKKWRLAVYRRDRFQCAMCPKMKRSSGRPAYDGLNAHHIKRWADYPTLRFEVSNGITLCRKHHKEVTGHEEQFERLFNSLVQSKSKKMTKTIDVKKLIYERMKSEQGKENEDNS